jgi:hypothetical protein
MKKYALPALALLALLLPAVICFSSPRPELFKVLDIQVPFQSLPVRSVTPGPSGGQIITFIDDQLITNQMSYACTYYTGLPPVKDPPASILRGMTNNATKIRAEGEIYSHGVRILYRSYESQHGRTTAVWNVGAFHYKQHVYVWHETFPTNRETGDEFRAFMLNLRRIKFD